MLHAGREHRTLRKAHDLGRFSLRFEKRQIVLTQFLELRMLRMETAQRRVGRQIGGKFLEHELRFKKLRLAVQIG